LGVIEGARGGTSGVIENSEQNVRYKSTIVDFMRRPQIFNDSVMDGICPRVISVNMDCPSISD